MITSLGLRARSALRLTAIATALTGLMGAGLAVAPVEGASAAEGSSSFVDTTSGDSKSQRALAADPASLSGLVLNVGADQTKRNVAWYSTSGLAEKVQVAKKSDSVDGDFPAAKATSFDAESGVATKPGNRYQHATIADLVASTAYLYRVGSDEGGWSGAREFATRAFSGAYNFLFIGDAQIGASGNVANDKQGWTDTLNTAEREFPQSEFIFSAGDQVDTASNETQYDAFLSPSQLTRLPLATLDGNHDVGSKAYEQHYFMPNWDPSAGAASSKTSSGGDYWFVYNDVLYMSLDSNSRDYTSHNAFLTKVVAEQGARAKWKVVAFHHSVYSVASHANDSDIVDRRAKMPSVLSDLDVDLVLMGHDHVYTRSFLMNHGQVVPESTNGAVQKPKDGDVLYVTANSSSGSKYYDIKNQKYDFAAVTNQEKVRNFSNVTVTDDKLTVATYRSTDLTQVDKVELVAPDTTAPKLTVPADSSHEIGSSFDALEGVTALDARDGDLTNAVTVTGSVDVATVGDYRLSYSVTDSSGNVATATRTVSVVLRNFANTGPPVISGKAQVDQTLTASTGGWAPLPTRVAYQWFRNGVALTGATAASYTVQVNDVSAAMTVAVTVDRADHATATVTSAPVKASLGALAIGKVTVTGSVRVGDTVTAKPGTWTSGTALSYQWFVGGKSVAGATKSTLKLAPADAGKKLTLQVSGTKSGYAPASALSAASTVANGVFSAATPKISGSVKVGKKLTVTPGTWSPKPSFQYTWYADGKVIKNATKSTFTLTKAQAGKRIEVRVTGSTTGYTSKSVLSAKTGKVAK